MKLFLLWVDQLSIYGAVSDLCEECDSCHDSTGRPVVDGESNPLFIPSVFEDTHTFDRCPCTTRRRPIAKIRNAIEKLSQQDRVSKYCTDAGIPEHS